MENEKQQHLTVTYKRLKENRRQPFGVECLEVLCLEANYLILGFYFLLFRFNNMIIVYNIHNIINFHSVFIINWETDHSQL